MSNIFNLLIYQPLFNALVFLYNTIAFHDFGIAVILITIFVRILLYPFFAKFLRHQAALQKVQPEVQRIQRDHKGDRAAQGTALMALYKEHKVNPFGGFVFLLIQLPILWGLYKLFQNGFGPGFAANLYPFLTLDRAPEQTLLGLINLAKPNILVIGFAAVAQFFQAKLALPKAGAGAGAGAEGGGNMEKFQKMSRQMVFLSPLLTIVFFYNLPAALGLYWAVTSLFSVAQQFIIRKQFPYEPISGKSNASHRIERPQ